MPLATAVTSAIAYREIGSTLATRYEEVRALLREFRQRHGQWPTAAELLHDARTHHESYAEWDVNVVRPRLTELADRGDIARITKRRCQVTRKLAFTWMLVTI